MATAAGPSVAESVGVIGVAEAMASGNPTQNAPNFWLRTCRVMTMALFVVVQQTTGIACGFQYAG